MSYSGVLTTPQENSPANMVVKYPLSKEVMGLARFKKEYQIKKKYAHPLKMFQIYI